jgi:hypothetical protein
MKLDGFITTPVTVGVDVGGVGGVTMGGGGGVGGWDIGGVVDAGVIEIITLPDFEGSKTEVAKTKRDVNVSF